MVIVARYSFADILLPVTDTRETRHPKPTGIAWPRHRLRASCAVPSRENNQSLSASFAAGLQTATGEKHLLLDYHLLRASIVRRNGCFGSSIIWQRQAERLEHRERNRDNLRCHHGRVFRRQMINIQSFFRLTFCAIPMSLDNHRYSGRATASISTLA